MKWYAWKVTFRAWSIASSDPSTLNPAISVFTIGQSQLEAAERVRATYPGRSIEIMEIEQKFELTGMWGTHHYPPDTEPA